MAQIIEFKKKEKKVMSRTEALVKGRVRVFTCDSCGEEFEVIDDKYPDYCPGCGLEIETWNKSEDDT